MFKHLKTSDWVAAGIRGLATAGPALIQAGLGGGDPRPNPMEFGELPSPESLDAAERVFAISGETGQPIDFLQNFRGNLLTGNRGIIPSIFDKLF